MFYGTVFLNSNNPYDGVGGCGATIDTIMAGNLGMIASAGGSPHQSRNGHIGIFKGTTVGTVIGFEIKDKIKLLEVASSMEIKVDRRERKEVAMDFYHELELTSSQVDGEIPMAKHMTEKTQLQRVWAGNICFLKVPEKANSYHLSPTNVPQEAYYVRLTQPGKMELCNTSGQTQQ